MFITKRSLDRRTFLRGIGASVALPLLDAMTPAFASAARPVPRMAFVYFPHGAVMDAWTPSGEGARAVLGAILEPLAPFADRLTVASGLANPHADGPVHAVTPGTWLAGRAPHDGAGAPAASTADQIAAEHLGRETPLSSIEVAAEAPRPIDTGAWAPSYGQRYAETLSFRAGEPLPMHTSPRAVFDRLFAGGASADSRSARRRSGASVLDLVAAEAADLPRRLGVRDRATLREYLDGIRAVETRVDRAEALRDAAVLGSPDDAALAFAERQALMFDLIALAFRADITRVAAYMMGAETSAMSYRHIGVAEPFHLLSHHQNDPAKLDALVRIQRYHTQAFAAFVAKLAELPDGDGTLLDRATLLYGSNMGDSQRHEHYPLPLAVVGGGCGALQGAGHVRYPDRTPLANLLVTLLGHAEVPGAALGGETAECAAVQLASSGA